MGLAIGVIIFFLIAYQMAKACSPDVRDRIDEILDKMYDYISNEKGEVKKIPHGFHWKVDFYRDGEPRDIKVTTEKKEYVNPILLNATKKKEAFGILFQITSIFINKSEEDADINVVNQDMKVFNDFACTCNPYETRAFVTEAIEDENYIYLKYSHYIPMNEDDIAIFENAIKSVGYYGFARDLIICVDNDFAKFVSDFSAFKAGCRSPHILPH